MRLRVKVEVPALPAPAAADKKGAKKEGEEPAAAVATGSTFHVTVEKEKLSGGWMVQEVLKDISLAEVEKEDGTKVVGVAYKDNKVPQLVEISGRRCGRPAGQGDASRAAAVADHREQDSWPPPPPGSSRAK